MSRLGRRLRTGPSLLYALIALLVLLLLLAVVSGAGSSVLTTAGIFLAIGVYVLIRAYKVGSGK